MNEAFREWKPTGWRRSSRSTSASGAPEILQRIRCYRPHVLHFIGHGGFAGLNGSDRACWCWRTTSGGTVSCTKMISVSCSTIAKSGSVVLNACQTAAAEAVLAALGPSERRSSAISTLRKSPRSSSPDGNAPSLGTDRIPAVVAMRYPITDQAAIIFAREFYRGLAGGLPVGFRLADARRGLSLELGSDDRSGLHPRHFHANPGWKALCQAIERRRTQEAELTSLQRCPTMVSSGKQQPRSFPHS